ncbi:MAG: class I SAM-dependent methyltransferase [Planctomycetota bacterium]
MSIDAHLTERYGSPEGAAAYRRKYERSLARRLSSRRELRIVGAALDATGVRGHVLDCPCGAGRLVPTLLARVERVTAADRSPAMVEEARDALSAEAAAGRVVFAVASAHDLPFADGAFEASVCHRLIHHVADREQRLAILRELARVTRRHVVISFNDATTWKMRSQRLRRRKRRRTALTPEAFRAEAAQAGLESEGRIRRLNGWLSLVAVAVFGVERAQSRAGTVASRHSSEQAQ